MLIPTLIYTIAIPGALALAIALIGRRHELAVALAVAVATIATSWGIVGRPELVPDDISRWVGHVAIAGLVGAVVAASGKPRRVWIARIAISLVVCYLVLRPLLAHRWGTGGGVLVLAGATLSLVVYGAAVERVLHQATPRIGASIALISATAGSIAVVASGSLVIGQLGGGLASAVGALWALTLLRPARAVAVAHVLAPVVWAVVVIGMLYAAMPLHVAVLALLPPVVACAGLLAPKFRGVVALVVAIVVTAAAIGLAVKPPPVVEEADYGYE